MTSPERFFFIHVMKTAGTSFLEVVRSQYEPDEVYPHPDSEPDQFHAYQVVERLVDLPPERKERLRAYSGHFPFFAIEAAGIDAVVATVLRDPVDRTLSYLKQCSRRGLYEGKTLEEIYEDPWQRAMAIDDYQTKVFSMRASDGLDSVMHHLAIDDDRYDAAVRNLETVDVLGVTEDFRGFVDRVVQRMGWTAVPALPELRVSSDEFEVPDGLRERIAEDNAYDVALHAHARSLARP